MTNTYCLSIMSGLQKHLSNQYVRCMKEQKQSIGNSTGASFCLKQMQKKSSISARRAVNENDLCTGTKSAAAVKILLDDEPEYVQWYKADECGIDWQNRSSV